MICTNCGAQIPDDSIFCEKCGSRVVHAQDSQPAPPPSPGPSAPPSSAPPSPEPSAPTGPAPQPAPGKAKQQLDRLVQWVKKNPLVAGIAAGVVVIVIAVAVFFALQPRSIRLDKYVTVEFSGYDTYGTAHYVFDEEAFCSDYAGKLEYQGQGSGFSSFLSDETICQMLLESCVDGSLDRDSNLSNGDEVAFTWSCDDDMAEESFGVRLSHKDLTFTVEGLQALETFDPFADIQLNFTGVGPFGEAEVVNNSTAEVASNLYYEISPSSGLSNGDTVTVSVSGSQDAQEYLATTYGVTLTKTEETYTVEGLGAYVSALDEISEDALNEMKSRTEDSLRAMAAQDWEEYLSLDEMTYLGSYLLCAKDADTRDVHNSLFLVYQVKSSINRPEDGLTDSFQYYYTVSFDDLILLPDGSLDVDLDDYDTCSDRFIKEFGNRSYWYRGYETLDEAFRECVTVYVDRYTYESSVNTEAG